MKVAVTKANVCKFCGHFESLHTKGKKGGCTINWCDCPTFDRGKK